MDNREALSLWLTSVRAAGRSPHTSRSYQEQTAPFLRFVEQVGTTQVETITPFMLRRFLSEYQPGHSPETVRSVYRAVKVWLRWLVQEELLEQSPTERVRMPKGAPTQKTAYSPGQIRAMLKCLENNRTPLGLRNCALVACLLSSGARASELLAATLDDLNDDAMMLNRTKAGRPRLAMLGQTAQKAIAVYLMRGRPRLHPKGNWLFVCNDGRQMTRNSLKLVLTGLGTQLGFPVSSHRMRHTAATNWVKKGLDLETVRRLGGWASYASLKPYMHLDAEDLRAAVGKADVLDNL